MLIINFGSLLEQKYILNLSVSFRTTATNAMPRVPRKEIGKQWNLSLSSVKSIIRSKIHKRIREGKVGII